MHITGGKFNSRKLISPKGDNVRPTLSKTRSAIFDVLKQYIDFEDKSFFDVFAGSGIMGLEAISRGFSNSKSFAVEKDKKTYLNIKANYELLGLEPTVVLGDSLQRMKKLTESFDVIYLDPPYEANLYNPAIKAILEGNLLNESGILILEHPSSLEIDLQSLQILKQKNYADKTITFCSL